MPLRQYVVLFVYRESNGHVINIGLRLVTPKGPSRNKDTFEAYKIVPDNGLVHGFLVAIYVPSIGLLSQSMVNILSPVSAPSFPHEQAYPPKLSDCSCFMLTLHFALILSVYVYEV